MKIRFEMLLLGLLLVAVAAWGIARQRAWDHHVKANSAMVTNIWTLAPGGQFVIISNRVIITISNVAGNPGPVTISWENEP